MKNEKHNSSCAFHHHASRREFLTIIGAAGAMAAFPSLVGAQQRRGAASSPQRPYRIDTHHHIFPPVYLGKHHDEIVGRTTRSGRVIEAWTPAKDVTAMDEAGIEVAVTSLSTPGVWFGNQAEARELARKCNEYGAQIKRDFKGRYGSFATLPLPDVDGSLKEIEYIYDVLKADGIGLMSSITHNGQDIWPGDKRLSPVFDELNRRKATVYFHPTGPSCCVNLEYGLAQSAIEFPTDTTRAIVSLVLSGTTIRCPDIKFIFSHGGGSITSLLGKISAPERDKKIDEAAPHGLLNEYRRHYYDVVSITRNPYSFKAVPYAFEAIRDMAGINHLLFGTDAPYASQVEAGQDLAALGLSLDDQLAIERENALRLLPTLRRA